MDQWRKDASALERQQQFGGMSNGRQVVVSEAKYMYMLHNNAYLYTNVTKGFSPFWLHFSLCFHHTWPLGGSFFKYHL